MQSASLTQSHDAAAGLSVIMQHQTHRSADSLRGTWVRDLAALGACAATRSPCPHCAVPQDWMGYGLCRQKALAAGHPQGARPELPVLCSPEIFTLGKSSAKSDIYSLGIVYWELCTGEAPQRGRSRACTSAAAAYLAGCSLLAALCDLDHAHAGRRRTALQPLSSWSATAPSRSLRPGRLLWTSCAGWRP